MGEGKGAGVVYSACPLGLIWGRAMSHHAAKTTFLLLHL